MRLMRRLLLIFAGSVSLVGLIGEVAPGFTRHDAVAASDGLITLLILAWASIVEWGDQ
jgi:hypothetical protein